MYALLSATGYDLMKSSWQLFMWWSFCEVIGHTNTGKPYMKTIHEAPEIIHFSFIIAYSSQENADV